MVTTPTASEFKTRYPEFTGVADGLVTAFIAEASPRVDDDWEEADQQPAILALTAHLLSLEGYPGRADPTAPLPAGTGKEVVMRRVGDVTTQYAQLSSSDAGDSLRSSLKLSPYGRRFAQLLKVNAITIGLV
jgi:hypothetical protein